ncbi:hypothetical protein ElyMa_000148300 [Elysia marginata]|uniref:Endonuclease/exonuclease/phosphatase domain-containing protein n=1 Tax=Elysia marginata TaxID=1093978 RepID=A0AAV4ERF3_9GAST|nr:hypothetical protein ElyMa_000148300 [Elysia marginata]
MYPTLDWIVVGNPCFLSNTTVEDKTLSDHFAITFDVKLNCVITGEHRHQITLRNTKLINHDQLACDFTKSAETFHQDFTNADKFNSELRHFA